MYELWSFINVSFLSLLYKDIYGLCVLLSKSLIHSGQQTNHRYLSCTHSLMCSFSLCFAEISLAYVFFLSKIWAILSNPQTIDICIVLVL